MQLPNLPEEPTQCIVPADFVTPLAWLRSRWGFVAWSVSKHYLKTLELLALEASARLGKPCREEMSVRGGIGAKDRHIRFFSSQALAMALEEHEDLKGWWARIEQARHSQAAR